MPKIAKIKCFDRRECKRLDEALAIELEKVGKRFGVQLKIKSGSYASHNYTFKTEASIVDKSGVVHSKEAEDFKRYTKMGMLGGLKESDLGRTFTISGNTYTIKGARMRSRKYPIMADRLDGKGFKFDASNVALYLTR